MELINRFIQISMFLISYQSEIVKCSPVPTTPLWHHQSTSTEATGRPFSDYVEWFQRYGYLSSSVGKSLLAEEELSAAVSEAQRFAGYPVTGLIDRNTIAMIETPRCGVKDVHNRSVADTLPTAEPEFRVTRKSASTIEYYDIWRHHQITYRYKNFSPDLKMSEIKDTIEEAFRRWSDVTPLTFREVFEGTTPDIEIWFTSGDHNDGSPFDGRGGILAHAFYPGPVTGGDMHFDDDEDFTVRSYLGTNLFFTALHELGHSLGLDHSPNSGAVMAPYYRGYNPFTRLHEDDIAAVQKLYGPKPPTTPGPTTTEAPPTTVFTPPACLLKSFDAIIHREGELYLFKDDERWKVWANKTIESIPYRYFEDGPIAVSAGYVKRDGAVVLLNESHYWDFDEVENINLISTLSSLNLPDRIEAAFSQLTMNQTYFFKNNTFWVLSHSEDGSTVLSDIFTASERLAGMLSPIDAAFSVGNDTVYFVQGRQYMSFAFTEGKLNPGISGDFFQDWLGCPTTTNNKPNSGNSLDFSIVILLLLLISRHVFVIL